MECGSISTSPVEDWIEHATDKYNFLVKDIDQTRRAIFGRDDELKEHFSPDPALVSTIGERDEFIGRNLTVVAKLGEHLYLARTYVPRNDVIFTVLDDRHIGDIIMKFYWSLNFYWSNFGYGRPGGCMPSGIYARYSIMVSSHKSYAIIVGPTEKCTNRRKAVPAAKLLHCRNWNVEDLEFEGCRWPAQVLFDPRLEYEHMVNVVLAERPTFTVTYAPCLGTLHRYCLRRRSSVANLRPVLSGFVHSLQEGRQLVVIQPREDMPGMIDTIWVLEASTFGRILRVSGQTHGGPLAEVTLFSQMAGFYSADFEHLSVVLWERLYKEECIVSNVLTVRSGRACRPLMSLRDACRAAILSATPSRHLARLPLPPTLRTYLTGS